MRDDDGKIILPSSCQPLLLLKLVWQDDGGKIIKNHLANCFCF